MIHVSRNRYHRRQLPEFVDDTNLGQISGVQNEVCFIEYLKDFFWNGFRSRGYVGVGNQANKPQILTLSFDLSLAPDVVGALSPTIGASFQAAGFAFCSVEGSGLPNPSSQIPVLR